MIVVCFPLIAHGQGLVEWRTKPGRAAPGWYFPAGKREPGETLHTALMREAFEELGISIRRFLPYHGAPLKPVGRQHEASSWLIVTYILDWSGQLPGQVLDSGTPLAWRSLRELARSPEPSMSAIATWALDHRLV
jgi:8-oxo-dGTP diphosphatase